MMKLQLLLLFLFSCSQISQMINPIEQATTKPESGEQKSTSTKHKPESFVRVETQASNDQVVKNTPKVLEHCKNMDKYFKKYKWGKSNCENTQWNHVRSSFYGNPIFWTVFGEENKDGSHPKNTTLIMCGVHADEITPIKFCFDIIEDLKKSHHNFEDNLVVVAPLVNPDGFFRKWPTRTNARGVDPNRNLPTKDWNKSALKQWKKKYRSAKRRFPGHKSNSEHETIFQVNLIKRYEPNKVISVHSPLTILDYDGPSMRDNKKDTKINALFANQLLISMSEKAKGYKVSNYPYFPGSLGNWAGNERSIPTYTLELPTTDASKSDNYWKRFSGAIHHAIEQDFRFDKKKKAAQTK